MVNPLRVNDQPHSTRFGFPAEGLKGKSTAVIQTLRLQPVAWHPV
jgi:hypothetical protein